MNNLFIPYRIPPNSRIGKQNLEALPERPNIDVQSEIAQG